MMRILLTGAALALVTIPAKAEELKRLPAQLDPAKAYVVVELGKLDGGLLPGTIMLALYDAARGDLVTGPADPQGKRPPAVSRQAMTKTVIKDGDRWLCLSAVEPGLWVIEGANDTGFALGSSTLELVAGSVTDLGVATVYTDFPEGEKRDVVTTGRLFRGALGGGLFGSVMPKPIPKAVDFRPRTSTDMALPPLLATSARPVVWSGQVRFGNHLGGLINRMGGIKSRPGAVTPPPAPVLTESQAPVPAVQ